jgi:hypothetical protein
VPSLTSPLDFRVQQYQGKPVLTWWQGGVHHGQGQGDGFILDSSYKTVARVKAGNGYQADFHEFQLSRENTAFFVIYEPVRADLRSVGGPKNGSALDGIVQEVDIATGLVLFEWHSLGNIPPSESYAKPSKKEPFDITHVNSVAEEKNGNLLVSSRDTHSALELERSSGKLLWRLGGKRSNFKMRGSSQFVSQHDIRRLGDGRISVFDNGAPPYPGRPARAIALSVNNGSRVVKLSRSFQRSAGLHSPSQGNVQQLPNGNFMVGWGGSTPFFTEFTSSGKVAFDARYKPTLDSYRAYRFPWTGQPSAPPDVAATSAGGKTQVYMSWNGATEVAQWQVLAGGSPSPLVKVPRSGFETHATISGSPTTVVAQALGKGGEVLGTSKPVKPK